MGERKKRGPGRNAEVLVESKASSTGELQAELAN